MMAKRISLFRLWGLIVKEFIQLKRDHFTFALIFGIPIIQLTLFGFAINANPKQLPTALQNMDNGPFATTLIHGLEKTNYFRFTHFTKTNESTRRWLATHQVLFALTIPSDFSSKVIRGERPVALLEVDGTDPVSVGYALSASTALLPTVFKQETAGSLAYLASSLPPAGLQVHVKYNPTAVTQYNIVPGLLGLVLTMTFVMVASMSLTREREQGTLENLLSTSLLPIEVIIGKAIPFVIIGYLQVSIILSLAYFVFQVPFLGSLMLLLLMTLIFIMANLFVGIFFSTFAKTQLEASQLSLFFLLPSLLLSGFAFPFHGMPAWAQWVGNLLPLTHFNNIIRGILLKGNALDLLWMDIWPMLIFTAIAFSLTLFYYKPTLD